MPMVPNPSFERTAREKPREAAQFKRWALTEDYYESWYRKTTRGALPEDIRTHAYRMGATEPYIPDFARSRWGGLAANVQRLASPAATCRSNLQDSWSRRRNSSCRTTNEFSVWAHSEHSVDGCSLLNSASL